MTISWQGQKSNNIVPVIRWNLNKGTIRRNMAERIFVSRQIIPGETPTVVGHWSCQTENSSAEQTEKLELVIPKINSYAEIETDTEKLPRIAPRVRIIPGKPEVYRNCPENVTLTRDQRSQFTLENKLTRPDVFLPILLGNHLLLSRYREIVETLGILGIFEILEIPEKSISEFSIM